MLVLSRKVNEEIRIGSDIRVIVTEMKKGRVRLGIIAPTDVPIHRDDVTERTGKKPRAGTRTKRTATDARHSH
jgi:carbon storage regulator